MKKFLTLVLVVLWGTSAQAQGTFIFSNRVPEASLNQPVFEALRTMAGPAMVAAIYLNDVQRGPSAPFRTGVDAGYWNPGDNLTREVPGKFAGDVVTGFVVKVWDSTKGDSVEANRLSGGKNGYSKTFSITLGGPKSDPSLPSEGPGVMSNFRSFDIIPEPSVLALGALGAVAVWLRRKK